MRRRKITMPSSFGEIFLEDKYGVPVLGMRYDSRTGMNYLIKRIAELCKKSVFFGCNVRVAPKYTGEKVKKISGVVRGYDIKGRYACVAETRYTSKQERERAMKTMKDTFPRINYFHVIPTAN